MLSACRGGGGMGGERLRIAVAVKEGIERLVGVSGWLATCAATEALHSDFHTFRVFPRQIDFWVPNN
jgi:hypothetical protein